MSRKLILAIVVPCWIATLVAVPLLPNADKQRLRIEPRAHHGDRRRIASNHKMEHYAAFSFTALLFLLLTRSRKEELVAIGVTILAGLLLEVLEHAVYGAPLEYGDVRDDTVAALLTYVVYLSIKAARAGRRT